MKAAIVILVFSFLCIQTMLCEITQNKTIEKRYKMKKVDNYVEESVTGIIYNYWFALITTIFLYLLL